MLAFGSKTEHGSLWLGGFPAETSQGAVMVFDQMDERPAFVGLPAFMRVPEVAGSDALRAERPDAVIVGAPTDAATTHRPGARFGPRAIRAASNLRRAAYPLGLQVGPVRG